MPGSVRTSFTTQETSWFNEDTALLEFKAVKNELESYAYELKNNLDAYGNFEPYLESGLRAETIASLQ